MRHKHARRWVWAAILVAGTCAAPFEGCVGNIQRELEVLAAPEANPTLVNDSALVDWFGPQVIKFFQKWW